MSRTTKTKSQPQVDLDALSLDDMLGDGLEAVEETEVEEEIEDEVEEEEEKK